MAFNNIETEDKEEIIGGVDLSQTYCIARTYICARFGTLHFFQNDPEIGAHILTLLLRLHYLAVAVRWRW
jgi:hypothetical protein